MPAKELITIAHIKTPYKEKFGIPRQSGMVNDIISEIEFVPKYRSSDAVRGLSEFSHIWVLWGFSGFNTDKWTPAVRPPRLGGNTRVGVFATRSPNRPNSIGLSSLKLVRVDTTCENGPKLFVSGADMLNGTEIYDIKPYIPFTDSHPEATYSYAKEQKDHRLNVFFTEDISNPLTNDQTETLKQVISLDPRPSYQDDSERIYGLLLFGHNIKFKVIEKNAIILSIKQD